MEFLKKRSDAMEFLKKRIKNYGFWTSLIALIPLVAQAFGLDFIPDNYATATNALLAFLVAAGIVNNPTQGAWFLDENGDGIDDRLQK